MPRAQRCSDVSIYAYTYTESGYMFELKSRTFDVRMIRRLRSAHIGIDAYIPDINACDNG